MAYADLFWVLSMRGAVGAIERGDAPFVEWVREGTLALPVFVLAVVVATMVCSRWVAPVPRGFGQLAASVAAVALAGTVAGVGVLGASSMYDYRLQSAQQALMTSMSRSCDAACTLGQQHAVLGLQVRAVGYGSCLILLTNLLLVAWVVAARGGRMELGDVSRRRRDVLTTRADDLRSLVVVGLLGSAAIHVAVVPEHLTEWLPAGVFFVLLASAQAAAVLLLLGGYDAALGAVVGVSLGPLVLWTWSRTLGLPIGPRPGVTDAVGLADVAAGSLELLTLLLALIMLARAGVGARPGVPARRRVAAVLVVLSVTALGLAGTQGSGLGVLTSGSGMG